MTKYLAGVLTVIAVGVLLVAYGLLSPRVSAFDSRADLDRFGRPLTASEQITLRDDAALARYGYVDRYGTPAYAAQPASLPMYAPAAAPQPKKVARRKRRWRRNPKKTIRDLAPATCPSAFARWSLPGG